jgi:hypothetical protein
VFERPSLHEWEQRAEAAEEAEAPSVSGARVGVSCSLLAVLPEGSAAVGAGKSMAAQFSCLQQVGSLAQLHANSGGTCLAMAVLLRAQ